MTGRRASIVSAIVLVAAVAACGKKTVSRPDDAGPPAVASASAAPSADVAVSKAASSATVAASKTPSPASTQDVAKQKAYLAALARGRKLTAEKKYKEAIAAFDDAVAANPDDARAHAERGYARILEGGTNNMPYGAAADLRDATALTTDKKLLSQIWFNRGLVDQTLDPENARVDFWIANHLAPSPAARAKLGGTAVCPARVVRHLEDPLTKASVVEAATWLDLFAVLMKEREHLRDPEPKTEAQAYERLTGTTIASNAPVLATVGQMGAGRALHLVVRRDGKLRATYVAGEWGGRCPGDLSFEIVRVAGGLVHVRGTELQEGGYAFMCIPPNGDSHPCTSDDMDAPGMATQSFCGGGTPTARDLLIDDKTGSIVAVERPLLDQETDAGDGRITATREGRGLRVRGLDCDELVTLDRDAGR